MTSSEIKLALTLTCDGKPEQEPEVWIREVDGTWFQGGKKKNVVMSKVVIDEYGNEVVDP